MKKKYAVMDGNTAAAHVAYAFTEPQAPPRQQEQGGQREPRQMQAVRRTAIQERTAW